MIPRRRLFMNMTGESKFSIDLSWFRSLSALTLLRQVRG